MVAWNMSEIRHVVKMVRRDPRADVVILLVTFGLTVFADLVVAVNSGLVLAMLHFLRRMAASVVVRGRDPQTLQRDRKSVVAGKGVSVCVRLGGARIRKKKTNNPIQ